LSELAVLFVVETSIWVYFDAKSLGFGKRQIVPGHLDSGPGLRERAIISEDEFAAKKREPLG
jgi:hypothetical protein